MMTPLTTSRRSLRALLTMAVSAFFIFSYGQSDSVYHYADFRFPDIDRRALDVLLNGSGNTQKSTSRLGNSNFTSGSRNTSQAVSLNYSHFKNSQRVQLWENLSIQEHSGFSKNKFSSVSNTIKRSQAEISLAFAREQRMYFKPNLFWGLELGATGQYFREATDRSNSVQDDELRIVDQQTNAYFTFGKGRIEPIDDVFMAKFLMDDLIRNDVLFAPLEEEQLFELARVMTAARNKRIFDFRRQRIYQLTRLDDWFKEQRIVTQNDIVYFTTLTDNWLYGFLNARSTGKRLTFKIGPTFDFAELLQSNSNPNPNFNTFITANYVGSSFQMEYARHRPWNELIQEEIRFSTGLEYWYDLRSQLQTMAYTPGLLKPFAEAAIQYGLFPNSRTRASIDMGLRYEYYASLHQGRYQYDALLPSVGASVDYFLTYRLRVHASVDFFGTRTSGGRQFGTLTFHYPGVLTSNQSDWNLISNFSLQYSIF